MDFDKQLSSLDSVFEFLLDTLKQMDARVSALESAGSGKKKGKTEAE